MFTWAGYQGLVETLKLRPRNYESAAPLPQPPGKLKPLWEHPGKGVAETGPKKAKTEGQVRDQE